MGLPGEIVAFFGSSAICFPYVLHLEETYRYRQTSAVLMRYWNMWSFGLFMAAVYFNNHPAGGHAKHKHIITDIMHFPVVLRYTLALAAIVVYACGLVDKSIAQRSSKLNAKGKAYTYALMCLPPLLLTALFYVLALVQDVLDIRKTWQLAVAGIIGIIGASVFSVSSILFALSDNGNSVTSQTSLGYIPLMVQTLGMLAVTITLVLDYTTVDWYAVILFTVMMIGNLVSVVILVTKKKNQSPYNPVHVNDDDVDDFEV